MQAVEEFLFCTQKPTKYVVAHSVEILRTPVSSYFFEISIEIHIILYVTGEKFHENSFPI